MFSTNKVRYYLLWLCVLMTVLLVAFSWRLLAHRNHLQHVFVDRHQVTTPRSFTPLPEHKVNVELSDTKDKSRIHTRSREHHKGHADDLTHHKHPPLAVNRSADNRQTQSSTSGDSHTNKEITFPGKVNQIQDTRKIVRKTMEQPIEGRAGADSQVTVDTGLDQTGSRKEWCAHCFQTNFSTLIDQPHYCSNFSPNTNVLLLIFSAPDNQHRRQAIRDTWGWRCQDTASRYRCLFVLGASRYQQLNAKLHQENHQHHDLLQFAFQDAYVNLTYKTLTSLGWVASRCSDVSYVMKTDDDMYVNTMNLPELLTVTPTVNFTGGYCWGKSAPNRDFRSKWFVPFKTFRQPQFPPMCSGTGYILSRDLVGKVLAVSSNIPFFHLEDVYVALCLHRLGVRPIRISGFNNTRADFSPCRYRKQVMTSHDISASSLRILWRQIRECSAPQATGKELFLKLPYIPT